jgi:ABC-2 type transport system permease protein
MSGLTGILPLIRFILRRDRLYLTLWIIGLVTLSVFFVPMLPDMVGDEASKQALIATMQNPAMVAMVGPAFGSDYTLGSMYAQYMLVWVALGYGVMNIMVVVRHTRKDEEEGRLDLIGALPVGRNANLLATLLVVLATDALIAVLTTAIIPAFGVDSIDVAGAATYAFALSSCGFAFAGLAALCAQLTTRARSALGFALALLGLAYLLRAMGDIGTEALSWISPIGAASRTEAFVSNLAWPIALLFGEGLVFSLMGFALSSARDSGAGLLPQRGGRAHASAVLRGVWSLAWRELRGTIIVWLVVCFVLSAAYGSVMGDMNAFIENNELYQAFMGVGGDSKDITDPVVSMLLLIMAMIATIPVVSVVNRLKSEERHGRLEQVLAKPVSRSYLFAGYFVIALAVAVLMMAANVVGFWIAASNSMAGAMSFATIAKIGTNYLPAIVAFAGLAALLVGALPKAASLTWIWLVYAFLALYIGRTMDLPSWVDKASPFSLLPDYPMSAFEPVTFVAIGAVGVALALIGMLVYRGRDIG